MTMADASLFDAFADDVPTAPKSQPAPRRSRKPAGQPRTRAPETDPDGGPEALPVWCLGDPDPGADRAFVVEGLLGRRETALLIGAAFAGKSALAVRLAVDVASGRPFLGIGTAASPVLYVSAERPDETRRRLTAAAAGMDPPPPVAVVGGLCDLMDETWRAGLGQAVRDVGDKYGASVGLVILDTLSQLIAGRDENSQAAASAAARALQEIALAGPAVLVLHHPSPDGKRSRGSSAFPGAVDTIFRVTAKTGKTEATLHLDASNLGPSGGRWPFTLDVAGGVVVVARGIEADDAPPPRAGRADEFAAVFRECFAAVARDGAADRKALGVELRKRQPDANAATSRSWLKRLRDAGIYHQVGEHIFLGPDPKKSEAAL
ncbi:AAA family ATPase (plasmid) [Segnochrobactraceae bacterium EtOH-i3]